MLLLCCELLTKTWDPKYCIWGSLLPTAAFHYTLWLVPVFCLLHMSRWIWFLSLLLIIYKGKYDFFIILSFVAPKPFLTQAMFLWSKNIVTGRFPGNIACLHSTLWLELSQSKSQIFMFLYSLPELVNIYRNHLDSTMATFLLTHDQDFFD